jgi:hypothetical protein
LQAQYASQLAEDIRRHSNSTRVEKLVGVIKGIEWRIREAKKILLIKVNSGHLKIIKIC